VGINRGRRGWGEALWKEETIGKKFFYVLVARKGLALLPKGNTNIKKVEDFSPKHTRGGRE